MNNKYLSLPTILCITICLMISCSEEECTKVIRTDYAFFAAGHVYGYPGVDNDGFHPPFTESIPFLNDYENLDLGLFTGDVVISDIKENWDQYLVAKADLDMETYIAAGNHDYKDIDLYKSYFGNPNYYFEYKSDLFIVLEVTTTGWDISDESLSILNEALSSINSPSQNIFLFVHQLIWFEPDSKYTQCYPNSLEGRRDITNFNSEIRPILESLNNQVVIYAGDIGAFENGCAVMYDQFSNIQLVASGMGGGQKDNVIITKIDSVGEITFDLIALNGEDKSAMGAVEDYWLE